MPRLSALAGRLRAANPYGVDAALAAFVLLAVSMQFLLHESDGDAVSLPGFLLGAGTAVPLVWRRRAAFACGLVVSAFTIAMALYHRPAPDVNYGGLVVLYSTAALAPAWQRRTMLVGWTVGTVAVLAVMEKEGESVEYGFHLLSIFSAYGLGVLGRVQRAYTAAVEERARRLEREREAERARAAARERARIARDMHDILAHAVSLMVVQAEAGPVVVRRDPGRAEAAFDAIAGAGRDAMAQLRRILGVLKEGENAGEVGGGGQEVGEVGGLAPQPTMAGLPELVRQVASSTGLRVELRSEGEPRPLPPDAEAAAYRVVQEALTNTVKHARGASAAQVRLDWDGEDGMLVVTVTDDGRGTGANGNGVGGNGPGGHGVGGHGLIGIRERAAACGGSAAAGPTPDGYRVVARLPR
jgi:signal transduction histidine kinase